MKKFGFNKIMNSFLNNPYRLFFFYIILNFIPTVGLLFTEPFNAWGKITLFLFPIGLYLLCFSLLKNTGLIQLCLFPLLFLHAFQIVLFYLFGEEIIAVDMFLNVVTTNAAEAGELLDSILPAVVLVIILYIPTTIFAAIECKRKVYLPFKFRKKTICIGLGLIVLSVLSSFFAKNKNTGTYTFHQDVYPINVLYNLEFAINKFHRISEYPKTSEGFTFGATKKALSPKREIYVLVVGETGRAENWSLYGYKRKTNPYLEQDSGVIHFQDAITQSNTTHKSVPIILSAASAENFNVIYKQKSIIEAFKEVGFSTIFLSNQAVNHSFTEYFSDQAEYKETYRTGYDGINNLDGVLLSRLQHYIDSIRGNLFFVLHTYGSHFNYKERYPTNFSVFKPDNVTEIKKDQKNILINAYDNSILYTDYFLHHVINMLRQSGACTSMIYSSDHGEDIMDDSRFKFLHASPNPTVYQLTIPIVVWFSNEYKRVFPVKAKNAENNKTKPVATNAIFHTMLDIADIRTSYLNDSLSLTSPMFNISKRMYLDDHDKPIFFYKANLKKQDKEVLESRGIYH